MSDWRRWIRWMPRAWLLAALLAAHGLVIVHGVDHALDPASSLCAICSASPGLEHAAVAADTMAEAAPRMAAPEPPIAPVIRTEPGAHHPARGPPATL